MGNKKIGILLFLVIFILTSCSYSSIKYNTNEGKFAKSKLDTISVNYTAKSNRGFYASLDFELTDGKVDWEILNPKDEPVFKGYVIYENGKVYRELTYPTNFLGGNLNKKEEVKSETDTKGNIINIPDFNYLQFEVGSPSGEYKLNLKPSGAEGSYKIQWSDKLPRK